MTVGVGILNVFVAAGPNHQPCYDGKRKTLYEKKKGERGTSNVIPMLRHYSNSLWRSLESKIGRKEMVVGFGMCNFRSTRKLRSTKLGWVVP